MGSASRQVLTRESVVLLSFCYEEAAEAVDGLTVGVNRAILGHATETDVTDESFLAVHSRRHRLDNWFSKTSVYRHNLLL